MQVIKFRPLTRRLDTTDTAHCVSGVRRECALVWFGGGGNLLGLITLKYCCTGPRQVIILGTPILPYVVIGAEAYCQNYLNVNGVGAPTQL